MKPKTNAPTNAIAQRDLTKKYTIFLEPNPRSRLVPRKKSAMTPEGKKIVDKRRWNPKVGSGFGSRVYKDLLPKKGITGTAEELYINHGIEARGLGTIRHARKRCNR